MLLTLLMCVIIFLQIVISIVMLYVIKRWINNAILDLNNSVVDAKARIIIAINKLIKRSDVEVPQAEVLDDETLFMKEVAEYAKRKKRT